MAQPAQIAVPSTVRSARSNVASGTVSLAPAARAPVRSAPVAAAVAPDHTNKSTEYHIKRGDSLAGIARQLKPAGVSLDQMLVALYQRNPDVFVDHNMNRMRAGQVLAVPDAAAAQAVAPAEARGIVLAQTRDFNQYRGRLAAQVADGAATKGAVAGQSASGKVTSTVQEAALPVSKDRLTLSRAGVAESSAAGAAAASPAVASEELIAKDKALAEANARVALLEKNLADLQKLLEIKNTGLAQQQRAANGATAPAPSANADVAPAKQPSAVTPAAAAADAGSTAPEDPAPDTAAAATAAPAAAPAPATTPVAAKTPATVPPAPVVEPGFIASLVQDTPLLPGIGLLLIALGAFGIYDSRRRKKQKKFADSIMADSSLKTNSLFNSTGGQSVDTNNSVFNSSFQPSASQLDTNEVDPVAEADVYIAYGRDVQAEEILKEALRTQPERNPVRLKLLEIYANRKDAHSFELHAGELYSLTKGTGDEWAQAAALGRTIDRDNPLYAGGKLEDAVISKVAAISAPTEPLEELDLDALLATTQPHSLLNLDALNGTAEQQQLASLSGEPLAVDMAPNADDSMVAGRDKSSLVADLDFDLGDFGAPVSAQPDSEATAATEGTPAPAAADSDFPAFDFNLDTPPSTTAAPQAAGAENSEPELEPKSLPPAAATTSDDVPALPPASLLPAFDLGGINLDLDDATGPATTPGADPYSAEMSTKLDLALAYREIGDKEGARELLDEVIKGGSPQQVEKARGMLLELA